MKPYVFALAATLGLAPAANADVLMVFTGQIEQLTYRGLPNTTPSPFATGQVIHAEISLPISQGESWSSTGFLGGILFVYGPNGPRSGYHDFLPNRAYFGDNPLLNLISLYPYGFNGVTNDDGTLKTISAYFCCKFEGSVFSTFPESGQLRIEDNSFQTDFIPSGSIGAERVLASGSGTWSVTFVPEPASFALLGIGLAGLAAARARKK